MTLNVDADNLTTAHEGQPVSSSLLVGCGDEAAERNVLYLSLSHKHTHKGARIHTRAHTQGGDKSLQRHEQMCEKSLFELHLPRETVVPRCMRRD